SAQIVGQPCCAAFHRAHADHQGPVAQLFRSYRRAHKGSQQRYHGSFSQSEGSASPFTNGMLNSLLKVSDVVLIRQSSRLAREKNWLSPLTWARGVSPLM